MSNDGKKISFSFSKVKKPPLSGKLNKESEEKKDFVDCFDGSKGKFSYKGNVKGIEPTKKELVIPMVSTRTSRDIIKSKIEERNRGKSNGNVEVSGSNSSEVPKLESSGKSLEEVAALEILNELKQNNSGGNKSSELVIDSSDSVQTNIEEPSEADIDYDEVPVGDFGMAMLRGMGWKPNYGIGKEPKIVPTVSPKLRPKGLGLGAKQITEEKSDKKEVSSTKNKKEAK